MELERYVGMRFRTIPFSLCFSIRAIRPRTIVIYDEQTREERTIPREVFVEALRRNGGPQQALVYLGLARRRSA